jgi:transposase
MIVADSALYSQNNLQLMNEIKWLSTVPLSIKPAQELVNNISAKELTQSTLTGYLWQEIENNYGGIKQRWLVVQSQKRKESDLIKLSEKINKENEKATKALNTLLKKKFTSPEGATEIANQFAKSLKYHQIRSYALTDRLKCASS